MPDSAADLASVTFLTTPLVFLKLATTAFECSAQSAA